MDKNKFTTKLVHAKEDMKFQPYVRLEKLPDTLSSTEPKKYKRVPAILSHKMKSETSDSNEVQSEIGYGVSDKNQSETCNFETVFIETMKEEPENTAEDATTLTSNLITPQQVYQPNYVQTKLVNIAPAPAKPIQPPPPITTIPFGTMTNTLITPQQTNVVYMPTSISTLPINTCNPTGQLTVMHPTLANILAGTSGIPNTPNTYIITTTPSLPNAITSLTNVTPTLTNVTTPYINTTPLTTTYINTTTPLPNTYIDATTPLPNAYIDATTPLTNTTTTLPNTYIIAGSTATVGIQTETRTSRINTASRERSNFTAFNCHLCREPLTSYPELLHHLAVKRHTLNCHRCDDTNMTIRELFQHLKTVHSIDDSNSPEIIFCLNNQQSLVINSEYIYPCVICIKSFPTLSILKDHLKVNHNYCMTCCVSFKKNCNLMHHKLKHLAGDIKFYKCIICKEEVKSSHYMLHHAKVTHKMENVEYILVKKREIECVFNKENICPYCGESDLYGTKFVHHIRGHRCFKCIQCFNEYVVTPSHRNNPPSKCVICDSSSSIQIVKQVPSPTTVSNVLPCNIKTGMDDIPCIFCLKYKGTAKEIYDHTEDVHYICRICVEAFKDVFTSEIHKDEHKTGNIEFYRCSVCLMSVCGLSALKKHTDEKHKYLNMRFRPKKVHKFIAELDMTRIENNTQCPFCQCLVQRGTLTTHFRNIHNIIRCEECHLKVLATELGQTLCRSCMEETGEEGARVSSETQSNDSIVEQTEQKVEFKIEVSEELSEFS